MHGEGREEEEQPRHANILWNKVNLYENCFRVLAVSQHYRPLPSRVAAGERVWKYVGIKMEIGKREKRESESEGKENERKRNSATDNSREKEVKGGKDQRRK